MTTQTALDFAVRPKRSPDPYSQKSRVLNLLTVYPLGVCMWQVSPDLAYTLRNRVSELRRDGVSIESAPCKVHRHRGLVYRYWLGEA